jgi:hypothetical protein
VDNQDVDPLLISPEWINVQRPRLHRYGGEIQNLINTDIVTKNELVSIREDLKTINNVLKNIIGNGDGGLIDRKVDKSRGEMLKDIATIVEISLRKDSERRAEEWKKLKWVVVSAAIAFFSQVIYFYVIIASGYSK